MVGREVGDLFPKTEAPVGDVVLEVEGLERAGIFHDVSFEVRAGEIVGLAGLVGAGRSEIARAVFGVDRYDAGHGPAGRQAGHEARPARRRPGRHGVRPRGPPQAGAGHRGLGGPQRRLGDPPRPRHAGVLTGGAENRASGPWAARLQVKTSALDMAATTMSGGNQQKVVIAKWLATEPKLLIIDEPTRGIDVGTKAEVHRLLSDLAGQGMAILMISSELPEVLGMADRVLVVCEGRITAELVPRRGHPRARHARRDRTRDAHTGQRPPRRCSRHERPPRRAELDLARPSASSAGCSAPARSRCSASWSRWSSSTTLKSHGFLFSGTGWRDLLLTPSLLLILAVGQTVVIITRNVDLSVGSTLGLTAYLTGKLFVDHPGLPIVAVFLDRACCSAPRSAWSTACWSPGARCRRW